MKRTTCAALAGLVLLAGCTTAPDGTQRVSKAGMGAGAGAVIGGIAGAVLDKNDARGVPLGAAIGAAVGGGIGYLFDRQEQAFEQALAVEQQQHVAEVERVRDDLLKITLQNEVMFDFDSATIKPGFQPTLSKLAGVLVKYDRSNATIVGHTDSTGADSYNQQLSLRRAQAVQQALAGAGVPSYRMTAEGRGESQPIADNSTEAGRQLNRRVEILVAPTS
ncbi:OmpA family protein [Geminicoccaceae bacterium 1502E]|nr:OmpA family protein [Geminicoccaceae bacterium 1502E]